MSLGSRVFRTGMLCCSFAANKHDLDYLLLTREKTYVTNLTFRLGIICIANNTRGICLRNKHAFGVNFVSVLSEGWKFRQNAA